METEGKRPEREFKAGVDFISEGVSAMSDVLRTQKIRKEKSSGVLATPRPDDFEDSSFGGGVMQK